MADSTSIKVETEIKFSIPDITTFSALKSLTALGSFQFESARTKIITDRYLDTRDHRLLQAGYACRLRFAKTQINLTLKSLAPPDGAVHRRQELETAVPSEQTGQWPDNEVTRSLNAMTGGAALETLFLVHQTRHQSLVSYHDQTVMEFSLDEVAHQSGAAADYFELEAELTGSGTEATLAEFTHALQANWSLQPENQSKFERAFFATFGKLPNPNLAGREIMFDLSHAEKTMLQAISSSENSLLARRASVILLSEAGEEPDAISKSVGWVPRTVKQWQRAFLQQRMGIFPTDLPGNNHHASGGTKSNIPQSPATEPAEQPAPPAESPAPVSAKKRAPAEKKKPVAKQKKSKAKKPPAIKKQKPAKTKRKKQKSDIDYPTRKSIGLTPTDSLAEAGRKAIGYHFARMLNVESGTRAGKDIEDLHDMRVATRRMRAAFNLFGAGYSAKTVKPLLKGLRATGKALGPVRDLDVFMEKLQKYQYSLAGYEKEDFEIFLNVWQARRHAARQKMLAYLDSKKYRQFKKDLLKFVTTEGLGAKPVPQQVPPVPYQLRHIVPGLIYSAYDQVRAYETILDSAPIDTLHELRITFKGLRYTLEFMREILHDGKEMVIAEVKAMQDHLGDMNDADVASAILRDFLADWETHQLHLPLAQRQSPTPIVTYLNAQLNQRHRLLTTFPKAWAHFNRPEFRENLAKAISIL